MISLRVVSTNKQEPVVELNDVISVTVPTKTGVITLLEGHMNLMSLLVEGNIEVKSIDHEKTIACSSGILYVDNDSNVRIMSI